MKCCLKNTAMSPHGMQEGMHSNGRESPNPCVCDYLKVGTWEGFGGPLLCLLHRESVTLSKRLVLVCIICLRSSSIYSNGGYFIIIYENTTLYMPTLPNVDPHVS